MSLKPWEQTWNGRGWRDMPPYCGSDDEKKLNFFFWRRGTLDVEDEVKCEDLAKDGIVEIVDGAERRPLPRLVSSFKRRFKLSGRRASPRRDEPLMLSRTPELSAEVLQWRAELRLKLCAARSQHVAAIPTIAKEAGVGYSQMSKFLREGTGFPQRVVLERVEQCLNDFTTGALPPPPMPKRGQKKGWRMEVPEGCIPYKDWLESARKQRGGISVHAMRCWLLKNPEQQPPLVKINKRCFFVKLEAKQEVAA